jgi:hypothetical protein
MKAWISYTALALAVVLLFSVMPSPVFAQSGLSGKNCYSDQYHAATDCDRLASLNASVPNTGVRFGPLAQDCFSTRYSAASDCDRISWEAARR